MQRLITEHALRKVCEPSPLWNVTEPTHALALVPGYVPEGMSPGRVVYEKTVTCAGCLRFVFGGASGDMTAWLDDEKLGQAGAGHGFAAYVADAPYAAHTLRLEVAGGAARGYVRPVTIEQLGSALVEEMRVTPVRRGRIFLAKMTATVRSMANAEQRFDLEIKVGEAAVQWKHRVLPPMGKITLEATAPVPACRMWTLDAPRLYPAEAVLWVDGEPVDDLRDRVAFRTVEVHSGQLVLNGETTQLRERSLGQAATTDEMLDAAQSAKRDGMHALRCTGADARLRDLCDQLGLLVLEA